MSSVEQVVKFLKENNLHQTLQTLQKELQDREDFKSFDIQVDAAEEVEKSNDLSYYPYIMVPVKENLSRKDVYDWGYSQDPRKRYSKRCYNSKDLTTREGHQMLVLTKCTDSNIPQFVNLATAHNYVLAVEHAVGSFSSEFTHQEKAHSGNGKQEDPINKCEAQKKEFVDFVSGLIDAALSSNKAVTEEDCKYLQTVFPCNICGIKDLESSSARETHYKTQAHKQKAAEKNKADGKPKKQKKKKREGEPKRPPTSYNLWVKENRSRIKDKYNVSGHDIDSKCGEVWHSLSKLEKKLFEDEANELKVEWKRQMAEFDAQFETADDQKKVKAPKKPKARK
ncbi:HMG box protein [Aphelenchoides bicaudatus]|nr:HMG box protein [Aphelenchoides bicaudatus]